MNERSHGQLPIVAAARAKRRETGVFPSVSLSTVRRVFWAIGIVVGGALLVLSYVMDTKIENASREREEMVAERVFDELEREISAFLDGENSRPRYTQLDRTNPELWAPFVVGYFRIEDGAPRIVAADGVTSENRRRMAWAVAQLNERRAELGRQVDRELIHGTELPPIAGGTGGPGGSKEDEQGSEEPQSSNKQEAAPGSKIFESLNRAPERRMQKALPKKSLPEQSQDQFSDYKELF